MKKRYHTNQLRNQFTLSGSFSNRSQSMHCHSNTRGVSRKLESSAEAPEKLAKSSTKNTANSNNFMEEDQYEMKISDEISTNELNSYTLSCIESLASLSKSDKSIQEVLTSLVREKLTSFSELALEAQRARVEYAEYSAWSKQFVSTVQPLLSNASGPAQEVSELTNQVMQCVEHRMSQKFRLGNLLKRVDFLVEAVAISVGKAGTDMGLPKSVMNKVSLAVSRALRHVAS